MEKLRLDDSDTYWCGIERVGTDLGDQVQVTIFPAPTRSISAPVTSSANMFTAPVAPEENQGQLNSCLPLSLLLCVWKVSFYQTAVNKWSPRNIFTEWIEGTRKYQAPAGQRPLPAPGLPEGAPAPGHARCRPLGQQASEELWGEAPGKSVAPHALRCCPERKTLKQKKKSFFSGNGGGQRRLWFSRQNLFKNQSLSPWKPAAVMLGPGSSFILPCTASGLLRPEASNTGETTGRNGRVDAFWAQFLGGRI
ncbi:uncharacterized protein LOC129538091 isoform X2 [Moschus berezovskii]|nr:uncharacterized protein LOC129538091 isoform X2 [Moschus berezovskii]